MSYRQVSSRDGVHLGPEKDTCRVGSIDAIFNPSMFSLDSNFKSNL